MHGRAIHASPGNPDSAIEGIFFFPEPQISPARTVVINRRYRGSDATQVSRSRTSSSTPTLSVRSAGSGPASRGQARLPVFGGWRSMPSISLPERTRRGHRASAATNQDAARSPGAPELVLRRCRSAPPRPRGPAIVQHASGPDSVEFQHGQSPAICVSEKVPGTVRHDDSRNFLGRPFGGVDFLKGEDDHHGRDQAQAHTRSSPAEVVRSPSPTAVRPVPGVLPNRCGGESCDSVPKGLTGQRSLTRFGASRRGADPIR